ncbi:MAG: hypothetical protein H6573_35380 [Lewinellaceae bacterium]|nr:hypothetical protein [Lewinellaceae bacterium]
MLKLELRLRKYATGGNSLKRKATPPGNSTSTTMPPTGFASISIGLNPTAGSCFNRFCQR